MVRNARYALAATVLVFGCTSGGAAEGPMTAATLVAGAEAPGATPKRAIEVCEPSGERAYLAKLRCPDGSAPEFERVGSYGSRTPVTNAAEEKAASEQMFERPVALGEPDFHIVDGYEVICPDAEHLVFLDMYHCDQPPPSDTPEGFTLAP